MFVDLTKAGRGFLLLFGVLLGVPTAAGCASGPMPLQSPAPSPAGALHVGFLLLDGVYGSELVGPHDVFQHTVFHATPGMRVFTVGRTTAPVRTFEGLVIVPDHGLDDCPRIDVLVVPSAEHNMDTDLDDARLIDWVAERGRDARYVLSVCDGAFVLAEAGLLTGRACTTFPGDLEAFARRFPDHDLRRGPVFVVDGSVITGVGGVRSFDPAMWLVEHLYGTDVAQGVGRGLVLEWDAAEVPHVVVDAGLPTGG